MSSTQRCTHAIRAAAAIGLAALAGPAFAQGGFISPYDETLSITLGGIVNRFDTNVRFDSDARPGTDIHLEDNALEKNLSSFEGGLTWRFFRAHRLDLDYFSAKRDGNGKIVANPADGHALLCVHLPCPLLLSLTNQPHNHRGEGRPHR